MKKSESVMLTANMAAIAQDLTALAKRRQDTACCGVPFGHTGECDNCGAWVPYNDRIRWFVTTTEEPQESLCLWCSANSREKGFKLSHQAAMRLIQHIIQIRSDED